MAQSKLKNKNILFLVHNYHSFQKDQIDSVAKYFKHVYVIVRYKPISKIVRYIPISFLQKYDDKYIIDMKNKPENVKVIKAPVLYLPFGFLNRILGLSHYKSVLKLIRKLHIDFDLIHAHFSWSSGYVGMKLKEKYRKPFVITGHGYDVYKLPFKNAWWGKKIKEILNSANQIITVSEGNIKELIKLGIEQADIKLLHNGYNSKLFFQEDGNTLRKKLGVDLDRKVLISIGNLEPVKGHRYLLEAVKEIKKEYPNILLYIIGNGSLYRSFQSEINKLEISENVIMLGYLKHGEINNWLNISDILVLPSLQESFGIVQLEAFSCGKPVVATKNSGSLSLVKSDEYGLLCEVADAEDLADKLREALKKDWDGKKIIQYARKFRWKEVAEETCKVYSRII